MVLSRYDLTGIQKYIFGSNRLRENLGASYLVHAALQEWLGEAARAAKAELDWAGGGNALVRSPNAIIARNVAFHLDLRLRAEAPGLSVAVAHHEWDENPETFPEAYRLAGEALDRHKSGRLPDAAFDGGGVTIACASTGEPAIRPEVTDGRTVWLGPAAGAKLQEQVIGSAIERLRHLHDPRHSAFPGLHYVTDLDHLGRTRGESSFIGVIHLDGNGMGRRFEKVVETPDGGQALRELSRRVEAAGRDTMKGALEWVSRNLERITDPKRGGFALSKEGDAPCFPVRPLVFGGDDITLVCEGRIALDLAAHLLTLWNRCSKARGIGSHACAGVALVKSHYPFFRAYELAEELCGGAKQWLRDRKLDASALDYEIAAGGALLPLRRRREEDAFPTGPGRKENIFSKPYVVVGQAPETESYRRWGWFRNELVGVFQADEAWKDRHTQLQGLAPVLRQGSSATRIHLRRWRERFGEQMSLPEPPGMSMAASGFANGETPYLDALELMDMLVQPLPLLEETAGAS